MDHSFHILFATGGSGVGDLDGFGLGGLELVGDGFFGVTGGTLLRDFDLVRDEIGEKG